MLLTEIQAKTMLELQAQMNARVNPQWLQAGYPYLRAVVVEGTEAIEHHGWKWWKKQDRDLEQLRMELVDIWHFTLSAILIDTRGDLPSAVAWLTGSDESDKIEFDSKSYILSELDLLAKLELLVGLSVSRRISLPLFTGLMHDCDMDWNEMYRQYVGKNVLNFFRQDHGYKEGSYIKVWSGREDNEHLVEIMSALDAASVDFRQSLYEHLAKRYQSLIT